MIVIISDTPEIQRVLELVPAFVRITIRTIRTFQHIDLCFGIAPEILILDSDVPDVTNVLCPIIKIGRDIYKPFHISELIVLIETHIKHVSYPLGLHYTFFPSKRSIMDADCHLLMLTEKESALLKYLINKGSIGADSQELLREIWQYENSIETSTVETHIYRLKHKLESLGLLDYIVSARKIYYIQC